MANVHSFSISNCIFEPKSWLLQLATAREHWRAEIGEVVQDTISGYRGWQPQPLGAGQTEIKQTNPSAFDRTKCGIAIGKTQNLRHFLQVYKTYVLYYYKSWSTAKCTHLNAVFNRFYIDFRCIKSGIIQSKILNQSWTMFVCHHLHCMYLSDNVFLLLYISSCHRWFVSYTWSVPILHRCTPILHK